LNTTAESGVDPIIPTKKRRDNTPDFEGSFFDSSDMNSSSHIGSTPAASSDGSTNLFNSRDTDALNRTDNSPAENSGDSFSFFD
jgi:hypothetical protein